PGIVFPANGLAVLGNVGIGTTTVGSNLLQVAGNVGISRSLTVTSVIAANGGLKVSGLSDLTGNVGVGLSLTTLSVANLNTLRVGGFSDLRGNVGIGGSLTVTSAVTFSNLVSCNTIDTNASGVLACGTDAGATFERFTANGTYTKPSGAVTVYVVAIGAGGGGGGGEGAAASTARTGGSGGGGGAIASKIFDAAAVGATETVTIGGAGTAGSGGSSANGGDGITGGDTTFGSLLTAYGGGGGGGGKGSARGGGGGGGTGSAGASGADASTAQGGQPGDGLVAAGGTGGDATSSNDGRSAEYGGGAGGSADISGGTSSLGGSSIYGAPGGGSGGGVSSANVETGGAAGGTRSSYTAGGGGAGGAVNGGAGTAGTNKTDGPGTGGGGGGGQDSGTGGVGGNAGTPGAGGGGGGSGTTTGGAGGEGARGEIWVWTVTGGAGADLAEVYYSLDMSLEAADVVVADPNLPGIGFKKSNKAYDGKILGIVSTQPGLVLGDDSTPPSDKQAKPVQLALAGRVPVKVSTENGPIEVGDYLTSSSTPGVAMKATKAGPVVGKALEAWDGEGGTQCPNQQKTTLADGSLTVRTSDEVALDLSGETIPQNTTNVNNQNVEVTSTPTHPPLCGKILTFVNVSYADPDASLTSNSGFEIIKKILEPIGEVFYAVTNATGEIVQRIGIFSEATIGSLDAGIILAEDLKIDGLIQSTASSSAIALKVSDETINVFNTKEATPSAVVTIDNLGNIDTEGTISAPVIAVSQIMIASSSASLTITSHTGDELFTLDNQGNIEGKVAKLDKLLLPAGINLALDEGQTILAYQTTTLSSGDTSYQVDVYQSLKNLESKVLEVEEKLNSQTQQASSSAELADAAEVATSSANLASTSDTSGSFDSTQAFGSEAQARRDLASLDLTPPDILLASDSATLTADLTVTSNADILGQLTAYEGIFEESLNSYGQTTLSDTLIAGRLTIDGLFSIDNGSEINVIGGAFSQNSSSSGILYLQKSPLSQGLDILNGKVTIDKSGNLNSQTITTNQLKINEGQSAGVGRIAAGQIETLVENPLVEENSLILITPRVQLDQTMAVVEKFKGKFRIRLIRSEQQDVTFDYLIIGVTPHQ
ncbi:hypothetical protein HYT18_00035, partial [Candidatus Microgenomates bacterium]|nr:hypothetical protein [Candidatus Microgenomates bacterium]